MTQACTRKILSNVKDFKQFWKNNGPFEYALTSREFPPVLLDPEEWIFSNDKIVLLKELMQFKKMKSAFVKAPFNPDNKSVLRPEQICPWKISHFPQQWNAAVCEAFLPEGQLTMAVIKKLHKLELDQDKAGVETAFFFLLEESLDNMGYVWLCPAGKSKFAAIRKYVDEWEEDEADAGLL